MATSAGAEGYALPRSGLVHHCPGKGALCPENVLCAHLPKDKKMLQQTDIAHVAVSYEKPKSKNVNLMHVANLLQSNFCTTAVPLNRL